MSGSTSASENSEVSCDSCGYKPPVKVEKKKRAKSTKPRTEKQQEAFRKCQIARKNKLARTKISDNPQESLETKET